MVLLRWHACCERRWRRRRPTICKQRVCAEDTGDPTLRQSSRPSAETIQGTRSEQTRIYFERFIWFLTVITALVAFTAWR